jgi:hypothetical protein
MLPSCRQNPVTPGSIEEQREELVNNERAFLQKERGYFVRTRSRRALETLNGTGNLVNTDGSIKNRTLLERSSRRDVIVHMHIEERMRTWKARLLPGIPLGDAAR